MRGACHRWQHGSEAGIAPETLKHQKSFVRASRCSQIVGQLNGARHASAEPDAVIGTGYVVVHRFGNRYNLEAFLMKPHAVTECVIAADWHHVIDAEPFQI